MDFLRYSEWSDTALMLHLVSQMLGKTKLARLEPQPEWEHVLLQLTADGLSTGLIPGDTPFMIEMSLREGRVTTTRVDGRSSGFAFRDGASVSDCYAAFNRMLDAVFCRTELFTVPMEMSTRTPFEEDTATRRYDPRQAAMFLRMCVFAHNALLRFAAPYRGKKILPAFFWGTFDVTTVLFSGKPAPFPGQGVIEKGAFDEQMIEFGFWPGDDVWDDPSFFVLPYPFLTRDLSGAPVSPERAFFSKEKGEFFFPLKDVLACDQPETALHDFLCNSFEVVTRAEAWENLDWLTRPLPMGKGSPALN